MTTPNPDTDKKETIPFYPDHVKTEFYVVLIFLGLAVVVGILGWFFPVGLQDPADPLNTPLHVKPEWYFLALYQLLKLIPSRILALDGTVVGVSAILVALLVVIAWPFIDRKEDKKKATWIRLIVTIVGLIILTALTIWGEVS